MRHPSVLLCTLGMADEVYTELAVHFFVELIRGHAPAYVPVC